MYYRCDLCRRLTGEYEYRKGKIIVFDLDGTLSIPGDRLKYLDNKDWDSFYAACDQDEPNQPIVDTFKSFESKGYAMKIVTGRRDKEKNKTLQWLRRNNIDISPENIHMRKTGDYRHDTKVKPELIKDFAIEPCIIGVIFVGD